MRGQVGLLHEQLTATITRAEVSGGGGAVLARASANALSAEVKDMEDALAQNRLALDQAKGFKTKLHKGEYAYLATDKTGQTVSGVQRARSEKALTKSLLAKKLVVEEIAKGDSFGLGVDVKRKAILEERIALQEKELALKRDALR